MGYLKTGGAEKTLQGSLNTLWAHIASGFFFTTPSVFNVWVHGITINCKCFVRSSRSGTGGEFVVSLLLAYRLVKFKNKHTLPELLRKEP